MEKKITECQTCKKAGNWEWTSDLDKGEIRHKFCGTVYKMSEWMVMKTRYWRRGDT